MGNSEYDRIRNKNKNLEEFEAPSKTLIYVGSGVDSQELLSFLNERYECEDLPCNPDALYIKEKK